MGNRDKATLKERLDQLGIEWGLIKAEDDGVRRAKQEDIFCMVCEMYPYNATEIGTIFMKDWPKFDPEKGSLSGFFAARINLREKDTDRWNRSKRRVVEADPITGEKKRVYRSAVVQDLETDEESGVLLQDTAQASRWREGSVNTTEDAFWASETLLQALISILNLSSLLTGRAKNNDRQEYFRMFFTDNVATGLHQGEVPDLFRKRERDLFQAMEVQFLDYFMAEQCRTAAAIQHCRLKPYGLLAQGRAMEETKLPLPGDVFTSYLEQVWGKKVSVSAVSNQKKAYLTFMKDRLS